MFSHKYLGCGGPQTCIRLVNKTRHTVSFSEGYEDSYPTIITLGPGGVFKIGWSNPVESTVYFEMGSQELIVKLEY